MCFDVKTIYWKLSFEAGANNCNNNNIWKNDNIWSIPPPGCSSKISEIWIPPPEVLPPLPFRKCCSPPLGKFS